MNLIELGLLGSLLSLADFALHRQPCAVAPEGRGCNLRGRQSRRELGSSQSSALSTMKRATAHRVVPWRAEL